MGQRKSLHNILVEIMEEWFDDADSRVYFQPPETIRLIYPCIIYERDTADTQFADNAPYIYTNRYEVTVIDRDPDSEIPSRIAMLPMTINDRHFTSDNLHHDVFKIYY